MLGSSRALPAVAGLWLLAGCSSVQQVKALVTGPSSPYLTGYIGEVVADEPRAALVARDVLARGGNAADAAAALGLGLSVTLPSRASLGAGGACLAFDVAGRSPPEAILFTSVAGGGAASSVAGGGAASSVAGSGAADRPASVPMLARGLFLLQARHGSVGFDELIRPAAALARDGITVSRALADDLAQVREPLLADPRAREIFGGTGTLPVSGDRLLQPQLAATLDRLALVGVGDLYTGALANTFVSGAAAAGGDLDISALRAALPVARPPLLLDDGRARVGFLPPPADGGLAAAVAYRGLQDGAADAIQPAEAVAASWRAAHPGPGGTAQLGAEAQAELDAAPRRTAPAGASLGRLPASTGFVVLDRSGDAVSCALSMDNLFGTGRVAGETGIVLGASPARLPAPLLAAAIAWNRAEHSFRAAIAASGQNQAAAAAAAALHAALHGAALGRPITATGRVNAISCAGGLPGDAGSCASATDPRGAGLAVGSN